MSCIETTSEKMSHFRFLLKEDPSSGMDIFFWAIVIISAVGLIICAIVNGVPLDFNFPSPEFIIAAIFFVSIAIYIGFRIKSMSIKMDAISSIMEKPEPKNDEQSALPSKVIPSVTLSSEFNGKTRPRLGSFRGNNLSQTAPNL